jgi:pimeloyl-ACP methyl ester carboxylesterase
MGGYIALAFWRKYPERVRALVLANTRASADTEETRAKRRELIAIARSQGAEAVASLQTTGMIGATTREQRPDFVEHVRTMLAAAPVEGIIGALEAMMARPDSTPLLGDINAPTLLLAGDEDVLCPPREMRALHAAIPGSTLEVIPAAGHLSNLEQPGRFTQALTQFLVGTHGHAPDPPPRRAP